ncbi:MAG TPA: hypothetical protein VFT64_07525 [Rickettsiales bacterium]|nr:hypothetical protein [Rickettsiales bacterium]
MPRKKSALLEKVQCPKCDSNITVKAGIVNGVQRYLCRNCQKYFLKEIKRPRKTVTQKHAAILMHLCGVSRREICNILEIHDDTAKRWLSKLDDDYLKDMPDIENLRTQNKRVVRDRDISAHLTKGKTWLMIELDLEGDASGSRPIIIKNRSNS